MISSILKILNYLQYCSDFDGVVEFDDQVVKFKKIKELVISETLWHKDYCLCCGQCCRNYDTIFSEMEFEEVKKLATTSQAHQEVIDIAIQKNLVVDGQSYIYYMIPPMVAKDSHGIKTFNGKVLNCRWIDLQPDGKKFCRIHDYRTITCGFPHLEFREIGKAHVHSLRHIQFGRNHELGCTVDLTSPEYDKATYDDDFYWLNRLYDFSVQYNIPTLLPKVLDIYKHIDINNPPKEDIVIYNGIKHLVEI